MKTLRVVLLLLVIAAIGAALWDRTRDGTPRRTKTAPQRTQEWTLLENCRLVENAWNDGDSFRVRSAGKEYSFRLYFVDTPEAEDSFPERLREQAHYFGISRGEALAVGREASAFTRQQLAMGFFTVHTRWRNARGRSKEPRYYAWVHVRGRDLNELLIEAGLARIYGTRVPLPDGRDSRTYRSTLFETERLAKRLRKGAWEMSLQ